MDLSARVIHSIDNHPLNRGLKGSDWLADSRNIALAYGDDLALFDYVQDGIYEGHFCFQSRGKEAVNVTRILTERMMEDAALLIGKVPVAHRKAGVIARSAGWAYHGIAETEDGPMLVYYMRHQ